MWLELVAVQKVSLSSLSVNITNIMLITVTRKINNVLSTKFGINWLLCLRKTKGLFIPVVSLLLLVH